MPHPVPVHAGTQYHHHAVAPVATGVAPVAYAGHGLVAGQGLVRHGFDGHSLVGQGLVGHGFAGHGLVGHGLFAGHGLLAGHAVAAVAEE